MHPLLHARFKRWVTLREKSSLDANCQLCPIHDVQGWPGHGTDPGTQKCSDHWSRTVAARQLQRAEPRKGRGSG
ncbi:hypothetical protein XANMN_19705 [Xanthomonas phaseoli pv. manihotis str. CIO151]|nr:hypothetical protein XANMN_19705 [Xanthomonas phaseoli pv. manihotis str. CIO151]